MLRRPFLATIAAIAMSSAPGLAYHGSTMISNVAQPRAQFQVSYGAADCEDETIDDVKRDGKVIITLTGLIFLVNDVDTVTTTLWLTADDMKACSDDGTHFLLIKDEETVSATKIR